MVLINKKFKRFSFLIIIFCSIGLAVFFVLKALEEKIVFFYTPTKLYEKVSENTGYIRVGGLVKEKSINYSNDGLKVNFMITDNQNFLNIIFEGILPVNICMLYKCGSFCNLLVHISNIFHKPVLNTISCGDILDN